KDFQAMLERMNDKQSVSFAAAGSAFKGAIKGTDLGPAADLVESLDAAGGGLTVADGVRLEVVLAAKTAADAGKIRDTTNDYINQGIGLLGLVAGQQKQLAPVLDVLKSIKATAKDKAVTLKAEIDAEAIEGLFSGAEK